MIPDYVFAQQIRIDPRAVSTAGLSIPDWQSKFDNIKGRCRTRGLVVARQKVKFSQILRELSILPIL